MAGFIDWLLAVILLRRLYYKRGLLFGSRHRMMKWAAPLLDGGNSIAWPDAMMFLTLADYRRAAAAVRRQAAAASGVSPDPAPGKPEDV